VEHGVLVVRDNVIYKRRHGAGRRQIMAILGREEHRVDLERHVERQLDSLDAHVLGDVDEIWDPDVEIRLEVDVVDRGRFRIEGRFKLKAARLLPMTSYSRSLPWPVHHP
jgi:hypothetical protein